MLTHKDKERILLEESYRLEVRDQLSKTRSSLSRWEKVSPILNSAFVLWLLSSVVLGIVGVVYTKWDAQRTIDRERREHEARVLRENELTARRLDSEIENRLIIFARTYGIDFSEDKNKADIYTRYGNDFGTIRKALVELENPSLSEYKMVVFPEYANRTLRSLLFELRDVVPSEQKSEIANAYDKSLVVTEFYISEMQRNRHPPLANEKSSQLPWQVSWEPPERGDYLREMAEALNLKRWNAPLTRKERQQQ